MALSNRGCSEADFLLEKCWREKKRRFSAHSTPIPSPCDSLVSTLPALLSACSSPSITIAPTVKCSSVLCLCPFSQSRDGALQKYSLPLTFYLFVDVTATNLYTLCEVLRLRWTTYYPKYYMSVKRKESDREFFTFWPKKSETCITHSDHESSLCFHSCKYFGVCLYQIYTSVNCSFFPHLSLQNS